MARKKPFKTFSTADAAKLKGLVSRFNTKITEVSKTPTLKSAQPERIKYSDLIQNIYSRQEFNRIYNTYSRYLKKGAERIYTNESGTRLTRWLRNESQYMTNRVNSARARQKKIFESLPGGIKTSAFDELSLDPRRNHILTTPRKQYAEKLFKGLLNQSNVDYYSVGAEQFKENYLFALRKEFGGTPGFRALYRKVSQYSGQFMIEAIAQDPTFEINFIYDGFNDQELRVEYLIDAWDDYVSDREYFDKE